MLNAILTQSCPPKEVLIADDASTDNSVEIIEQFGRRYQNIRLIRNARNVGQLENTKTLFGLASGDYVYSTASDDRVLPGFFEKSLATLNRFPQAAFCFSDPATFEETNGPIRENQLHLSAVSRYFSASELVQIARQRPFQIGGHTAIVKRDLYVEAGYLLPELKWHWDWFMSWVLAFRYGACYVPEPLATIRVKSASFSASGRSQWEAQNQVLSSLLELLRDEYRDVVDSFRRTAVLSAFNGQILLLILKNRPYWYHLTLRLVRRGLWIEVHNFIAKMTPKLLKRKYRKWKQTSVVTHFE